MIVRTLFRAFDRIMSSQWGCPDGPLGWLAGKLMARGNAAMNDLALEALEAQREDTVLEIGFGPGTALERIVEAVGDGHVVGIDPSQAMIREAGRRLRRQIADGRLDLRDGSSSAMPYTDASFDRVLSVNTIYFWADSQADLAEIRRVLKPGGRFVLALRALPGEGGALAVHGMAADTLVAEVNSWMGQAGFKDVRERTREAPFGPETVTAVALTGTAV